MVRVALWGLSSFAIAGVVDERELLVRNRLDVPRPKEQVVVCVRDLGVPESEEMRIRDVEVLDADNRPVPAQFDAFSRFAGLSSEVVVEMDFKPGEARRLSLRFHDEPLRKEPSCSVQTVEGGVLVTTPVYVAPVRQRGGSLWVEQPRLALSGRQKEEQKVDALLDEALVEKSAPTRGAEDSAAMDAARKPPMAKEGLPFCVEGIPGFGAKAGLEAWGGPLRAVVSLLDSSSAAVQGTNYTRVARQSFCFPRSGNGFLLTAEWSFPQGWPRKERLQLGGVRVNSADYSWSLTMGQDGVPPWVAPVAIRLANTRKDPYLEGYQKASFNHVWASAVAKPAWIAMVVDRRNSRYGEPGRTWGVGIDELDSTLSYADPGPFGNSLEATVRCGALGAGDRPRLQAEFLFGSERETLPELRIEARRFNSPTAVLPHRSGPAPALDMARVRALARERSVLVVVPDTAEPDRSGLWSELADALGGTWRPSRSAMHFFNIMSERRVPATMLLVLAGEPGTNLLLDQMNDSADMVSAYPLAPARTVLRLRDATAEEGATLVIAGNVESATQKAVGEFVGAYGSAGSRPALTVSSCDWADRMPFPWSGLSESGGALKTVASPGGFSDFLLLLRANRDLTGLRVEGPAGATCRFVRWTFESRQRGEAGVVPLHDAAFPEAPGALKAGSLLGVWISRRLPADVVPGVRQETARVVYDGGSRDLALETEILRGALSGKRAIGFYPMGFDKQAIRMYYGWDEETYYARIGDLLRQRAEFGPNQYSLDAGGIRVLADDSGKVTVDASGLKREIDAVRAAGGIDYLEMSSFNYLLNRAEFGKIIRARNLADEFDAWEYVVPEIRKALRGVGLEDKLVCRHGDEIGDYEKWLAQAEIYRRCGVRITVAINGYGVFNKRLGVGTMGLWMPLYNFYLNRWGNPIPDDDPLHFSKRFRDERHAAGEAIWPYVCGPGPYAWSSRPRSQGRFLMLDTYMKGADGLAYYGGTVWSHGLDPAYRDKVKADLLDNDSTFTTLFYPDAAGGKIIPSLRAIAMRQGMEDAGAVQAIRDRAAKAGRLDAAEKRLQEAYAKLDMNSPQQAFDDFRRALAGIGATLGD